MSLNPANSGVYSIQHYVITVHQWLAVSFTNKTGSHNILEILLKVALNTTTPHLKAITNVCSDTTNVNGNFLCSCKLKAWRTNNLSYGRIRGQEYSYISRHLSGKKTVFHTFTCFINRRKRFLELLDDREFLRIKM